MITEKEQIEYAKIPYTKKEIDEWTNDDFPDYNLWCDCGNKVCLDSDWECWQCHKKAIGEDLEK